MKEKLIKEAKKRFNLYDSIEKIGTWKEYTVYKPYIKNSTESMAIGLPTYVLVSEGKIRLNTADEALIILNHINKE